MNTRVAPNALMYLLAGCLGVGGCGPGDRLRFVELISEEDPAESDAYFAPFESPSSRRTFEG